MSNESKVTKKGQITIPAKFRKEYNLQPGKKVIFISTKEGLIVKPMMHQLPTLRGIIKLKVEIKKVEQAIKSIRKEWRMADG